MRRVFQWTAARCPAVIANHPVAYVSRSAVAAKYSVATGSNRAVAAHNPAVAGCVLFSSNFLKRTATGQQSMAARGQWLT